MVVSVSAKRQPGLDMRGLTEIGISIDEKVLKP